jgi:uncharacterized OsmC-like protein
LTSSTLVESVNRFTADPASAKISPSVTATSVDGHARLTAGPFSWDSDLPPVVGGRNDAPSPTAYLLGALAGCAVAFISATLAPQFDVEIEELTATASCRADMAALLGVEGAEPTLQGISVEIHLVSPSPQERVRALQEAWLQRCPVYLALREPNQVGVSFS